MYRLSAKYMHVKKFATVLTFVYDNIYAEIFLSYINIICNIDNTQNEIEEVAQLIIHSIINTIDDIDKNTKTDLYTLCIHSVHKLIYK